MQILITVFILFALFTLLIFNSMTNTLVIQKEMSKEQEQKVFRTINVLLTILLVSSYVEILFT